VRFDAEWVFTCSVGLVSRTGGRWTGRRLGALAVALAVAAGCGGNGYSYLANKKEKLYFKVPDSWTVYDTRDLMNGDDPPNGTWVRGFVAGEQPTIDSVFTIASDVPRGYVEVLSLDASERDTLNLAALRGTNFGSDQSTGQPIDPLQYAQEHPDGPLQVLGYDDDIVLSKGPHGVHIRVAITPTAESAPAIVDQTVLVDKATTKRYVLSIGCSAQCFQHNKKVIQEVIASWTLEAT
jgi:hypothetical protein